MTVTARFSSNMLTTVLIVTTNIISRIIMVLAVGR